MATTKKPKKNAQSDLFGPKQKMSATFKHRLTGIELNRIPIRHPHIDDTEKTTVFTLRQEGHEIHIISAMLGTNQARISEILENPANKPFMDEAFSLLKNDA